jgi:hypothetical protein
LVYDLDTEYLENGLYELNVFLEDYAGNTKAYTYNVYVNNPLQYEGLFISNYDSGILGLQFSSTLNISGVLDTNDLIVTINRPRIESIDQEKSDIVTQNYVVVSSGNNLIELLIRTGSSADQFNFLPQDAVKVQITASGIEKLFNTLDESFLEDSPNTRRITNDWPSAPFTYIDYNAIGNYPLRGLSTSVYRYINEVPYTSDMFANPGLGFFIEIFYGSAVSISGIVEVTSGNAVVPAGASGYEENVTSHGTDLLFYSTYFNGRAEIDFQFLITFNTGDTTTLTFRKYDQTIGKTFLSPSN